MSPELSLVLACLSCSLRSSGEAEHNGGRALEELMAARKWGERERGMGGGERERERETAAGLPLETPHRHTWSAFLLC
jgi:hypothetical protein